MDNKYYNDLGYESKYMKRSMEEYDGYLAHVLYKGTIIDRFYYYDLMDETDRFKDSCQKHIVESRRKKLSKL